MYSIQLRTLAELKTQDSERDNKLHSTPVCCRFQCPFKAESDDNLWDNPLCLSFLHSVLVTKEQQLSSNNLRDKPRPRAPATRQPWNPSNSFQVSPLFFPNITSISARRVPLAILYVRTNPLFFIEFSLISSSRDASFLHFPLFWCTICLTLLLTSSLKL